MQGAPRAHSWVCADVTSVTQDLLDVEKITVIGHHDQRGVVSTRNQSLERPTRRRAKLEPVDDVEPELDQAGT